MPGVGYANLEKETNMGAWLDRSILTEAHLWKSARTWDPEGILSTLPAVASGLVGVLVGIFLRRRDLGEGTKTAWMFSAGLLMFVGGMIWNLQFPMNKSLWTMNMIKMKNDDGSETGLQSWLYDHVFGTSFSPVNASLAWATSQVLFWFVILYILYRKHIFIKV